MKVKQEWTNKDFDEMGWHDSCIHTINFPTDKNQLILTIDYIFEWVLTEDKKKFNFWISPCMLTFNGIGNLVFNLEFNDNVGLYISEITRQTINASKSNTDYRYNIKTEFGYISFEASGYTLKVLEQPKFSDSQVINRDEHLKILR